jgi:hypothetical protein
MQSPEADLMLNRPSAEPKQAEFGVVHDAELPGGEIRHRSDTWSAICMHVMRNADQVTGSPPSTPYSQRK